MNLDSVINIIYALLHFTPTTYFPLDWQEGSTNGTDPQSIKGSIEMAMEISEKG
jgi:hypothetical protein